MKPPSGQKNKPKQTQFQMSDICLLFSVVRPQSSVFRPLFPDEAQIIEFSPQK